MDELKQHTVPVTDVRWDSTPWGPRLQLARSTTPGPIVTIEGDGSVTVHKGPYDEAGRMFWDAVCVAGKTYQEHIDELNECVRLLQLDPYRDAVHNGYAVYKAIAPQAKKRLTYVDVSAVLEAVNKLALEKIQ